MIESEDVVAKKMSRKSRSLRPQLLVAFSLMSVIPILALLSFVFPSLLPRHGLGIIVGMVILLAGLGFFLVKSIIDSIIEINTEVRSIANGEVTREINVTRDDELGELSTALNHLASNIKHSMDELKIYGDRTKDINVRINQQLMALSGLLEISNLMTRNADLKEIFEMAVTRVVQVANASFAFLVIKTAEAFEVGGQHGLKPHVATSLRLSSNMYLLNQIMSVSRVVEMDVTSQPGPSLDMLKLLVARRVIVFPVSVQGEAKGFMGFGSYANGPQLVYGPVDRGRK
jgi:HAMP domain-containing protein